MIICEVYYSVKPGLRNELLEIVEANVRETRKEEGNISYTHYPSVEDDTGMFVFEVWRRAQDVEAHIRAEHYLAFSQKRKPMLQEGTYKFRTYEAAIVGEGDGIPTW
ncbi:MULTISPECIES: putative quinol monooxygenase [Rhodococcus]|uniref:putative quinol monooxygenase n=1 Tax=Rhodococcus TaxID=1827 RepID=UPI0015D515BF|nr:MULTISPECIES: putative quinol monooxygenase [Rhodococcus]MDJ0105184.1 putative quinol monooxygenase [Rhodococcus erythropolis]MDV8015354.1 putative quinol monooxygenase [Rhodococcus sp. IEGM 1241]